MFHKVSYWWFRVTQYITSIGSFYNVWGFYLEGVLLWRISGSYSQEMMRVGFSNAEHLNKLVRSLYMSSFSYNNKRCPKIGMSIFRMKLIIYQPCPWPSQSLCSSYPRICFHLLKDSSCEFHCRICFHWPVWDKKRTSACIEEWAGKTRKSFCTRFPIFPFPFILFPIRPSLCSFSIWFPILPVPNILVQSDGINGGIRPLILPSSSVRNRPLCLPISL